jgi:hypothetical protein
MRDKSKTFALLIAGVALTVALALFLAPTLSNSKAANTVQKQTVRALLADDGKSPSHMKIVPADVTGSVMHWAPLTGDGSN